MPDLEWQPAGTGQTSTASTGDSGNSERTLNGFANRARLLGNPRPLKDIGLTSIKDATWEHQRAAMIAGYNSMTEAAVDEIIAQLRELNEQISETIAQLRETTERVTRLEQPRGYVVQNGD